MHKKDIFCRTESVAMVPKSYANMHTSLWGVTAKWPAQALKMKLILGLRVSDTRIQLYQFEPVRQDFERVPEQCVSSRIADC